MTHRTPTLRATALLAAVWVQFVIIGPGLHDPDCVHHRPGATGSAHIHGGAAAAAEPGTHGHEGHTVAGGPAGHPAPSRGDEGPEGPSSAGDDCTCLGVCVPGALVGLSLPQTSVALAPAAPVVVVSAPQGPPATLIPPHPTLLPPSTGPPFGA